MKIRPAIGIGVLLFKENKLLLGKRLNAHGQNTWAPPGGHLEFGETIEQCAAREVLEETGLVTTNIKPITFTNDIFIKENKHYITIFVNAEYAGGTPKNIEPEKCAEWRWFTLNDLPNELFLPLQNLFLQKNTLLEQLT